MLELWFSLSQCCSVQNVISLLEGSTVSTSKLIGLMHLGKEFWSRGQPLVYLSSLLSFSVSLGNNF